MWMSTESFWFNNKSSYSMDTNLMKPTVWLGFRIIIRLNKLFGNQRMSFKIQLKHVLGQTNHGKLLRYIYRPSSIHKH